MPRPRRLLVLTLAAAAVAAVAVPAVAADRGAARAGAAWLSRAVPPGAGGQAADTLVALRAAGRLGRADAARRAAALRRGAAGYAVTAGPIGKTVLGLAAAGADPRCAGRLDLYARLRATGRAGRYGTQVFDQTLGMLAMRALGTRPPASTVRFLRARRGRGGWGFTLARSGRDDVTSTAMAILALRAAGVPAGDGALRSAARWIRSQRTAGGGYAMGRRDRTEANSTALAIEALHALGRSDRAAERALRGLQRPGGAFQFTRTDAGSRTIASTDAVVALAGRALPVRVARRLPRAC